VARGAYPDASAFDPAHDGYDPKSRPEAPAWLQVDVRAVERFPRVVTLAELRATPALADMVVLRRGNRLSVTPVTAAEWAAVRKLAARAAV
jgi:predicted RNA-binding protein with PUA-like domain